MMKDSRHKRIIKRGVSALISFSILMTTLYLPGKDGWFGDLYNDFRRTVRASSPIISRNVPINSLKDFYEFSIWYANADGQHPDYAQENQNVNLRITVNEEFDLKENRAFTYTKDNGETVTEFLDFHPIGTAEYPFGGKVTITQASSSYFSVYSQMPIFDYIYDSIDIANSGGSTQQLAINRSGDFLDNPLFANNVVHDTRNGATSASWDILAGVAIKNSDDGSTRAFDYSGVISSIGDNAEVNLIFTNNSKGSDSSFSNITSSGNLGVLVGTLGAGATLNAHVNNGTNNEWNVETTGGNAGAFVGEMRNGSSLNICADSSYDLSRAIDVTTTADDSYAGGLVGKNDNGVVSLKSENGFGVESDVVYTASGDIKATKGAGGVYGYLRTTANEVFSSKYVIDGVMVNASNVGGVSGELVADGADLSVLGTTGVNGITPVSISVQVNDGKTIENFGGIAGVFTNKGTLSANAFVFDKVSISMSADASAEFASETPSYCGGLFGLIDDSEHNPAYLKTDNLNVSVSGINSASMCILGGIIGSAGTKGSFVDSGSLTVTTSSDGFLGGGVVGEFRNGVLRLSGITDLSGAPSTTANETSTSTRGNLVGIRKDALIYALGTGNDASASYNSGWRYVRSTVDTRADDIGTWGEVVRPNGTTVPVSALESTIDNSSSILFFDESSHTVRVASAVTSMTNVVDFVKTALNIQFNTGNTNAALQFENASSSSSGVLLGTNLSIRGTLDLAGTGITGFMRDDYLDEVSEIGLFTGTLTGLNSACVNLAVGEMYGVYSTGNGRGRIFTHRYNGLFSITGNGAKISEVNIDGYINVNALNNNINIGGAVACAQGGLRLESVNSLETIEYKSIDNKFVSQYVGGLIGLVGDSCQNDIFVGKKDGAVINVDIAPEIIISGNLSSSANTEHSIGGVIGFVSSTAAFETRIEDIDLSTTIDASGTSNAPECIATAGLIADFSAVSGNDNPHSVTLRNIDIKGVVIENKATKSTGGILGYRWNKTVVDFDNVVLNRGTSDNTISSGVQYGCGLVYRATGYWSLDSQDIIVNSLNIVHTPSESLGLLLHDAYASSAGLYLELKDEDSFKLADTGLIIPAVGRYDELAANTASSSAELFNNGGGKGVISIYTSNGVFSMDEASCNTYQNKYNKTVLNNGSRYYYNVSEMRAKSENGTATPGEKLLLWSLHKYASGNINSYFDDAFTSGTISGNFDMEHISWYPINLSFNLTLGDCTFKFYNQEINNTESAANGNTDGSARHTGTGTQHYGMHYGLFRDVTQTLKTTGNIHFKGNVGNDSTYTGILVNNSLSGTLSTSDSKEIVLEGITLSNNTGYLLINKIASNATLKLYGVRTGKGNSEESYSDMQCANGVASSLIGAVSGTYITLEFGKIKLDGRKSSAPDLSSVYGTTKSIFSDAILLNKFDSNSTSDATYNFELSEDWTNASTHIGNVTYGKEISDSVDYSGKQKHYFNPRYYVNPEVMATDSSSEYVFSSGFLPYVRYSNATETTSATYQLREIKVNVIAENIDEGCGTYNHPYEIETADQFMSIAAMIYSSANTEAIPTLRLPKVKATSANNYNNHWCGNGKQDCAIFTFENGNYISSATNVTYSYAEAREYLAGAYYQINRNITLESAFTGLGARDSRYSFRGVIIGRTADVTITNNSNVPLINISNGCVVKDLTISVNPSSNVVNGSSVSTSTEYTYALADLYYGGLIGMIKGGDNIIDNVSIIYKKTLTTGTTNHYLYNIGGYVGVIINGGLMFRGNIASPSGYQVTNSKYELESNTSHLFVNPYVGRVINGYAIYENAAYDSDTETYSGNYSGDSNTYTLDNSNKNYQISDVFMYSDNKLYYDTFDGKNRVCIPDGQSLFILSLITQSGAGTATTANGNYKYAVSYYGDTKYNNNAAVDIYASTHLCAYDHIGSNNDGNDAPEDKSKLAKEKTANKAAIPYIIYNYTEADTNGYYPARMMTENTYFMKLTDTDAIYNLPKGFRGIGSLCYVGKGKAADAATDNPYQMHLYGFDGNGSTIKEEIEFKSYFNGNDNYANKVYGADNINLGMGLFNVLIQKAKNDNGTTYNLDDGYYIGDFTLTGKVEVKEYSNKGVEEAGGFHSSNNNQSPQRNRYSVGGLAGGILGNKFKREMKNNVLTETNVDLSTYTNLYNLKLKDLQIVGTSWCGGYIGRNNITEIDGTYGSGKNNIYVNACNTENTTVMGSKGCCGGIIGGSMSGYPSIYVNTAEVKNDETFASGSDGHYKSTMELSMVNNGQNSQCGIGGIIGCLRNGYEVELWINNVTITGAGSDKKFENNNTSPFATWTPGAGGLFGFVRKADSIIVTNCEIKDLNITAPLAGGIFGNIDFYDSYSSYGSSPVIKIANCKIYSEDEETEYTIAGIKGAGGISGQFTSSKAFDKTVFGYDGNAYNYDVNGCEVYGYTISQTSSSDEYCGAGGLFGFARATRATDDSWAKMRTIVNTSVHDCTIKVDGSRDKHGMGAIIGCVSNRSTTGNAATDNSGNNIKIVIDDSGNLTNTSGICGDVGAYNIVSYNNIFGYNGTGTNAKCGNFVGQSNNQNFKVVAFSRNNNRLNNTLVSSDYGGAITSQSYIVCSDYKAVCLSENANNRTANITAMGEGIHDVDGGITADYFPFANVNPVTKMGVKTADNEEDEIVFLTGDGSKLDQSSVSVAEEIINDRSAGTGSYYKDYSSGANTIVGNMLVDDNDANYNEDIRLSTYDDEMGLPDESVDNFPVIALGGATNNGDYTDYIQAYIRLLTNTTKTYTSDENGVYKINVYPCRYIDGYYQKVDANAGLRLNANTYEMIENLADSTKDNNQISLIEVQFLNPMNPEEVAYHLYVPVLTKKMVKYNYASGALLGTEYEPSNYQLNTDNVFAGNFDNWFTSYVKYEYPRAEVQAILDTGKGLDWNSNKTINFQYFIKQDIADSTQFVLLDNNNDADKVYYLNKSDISTTYRQGGYPVDGVTLVSFRDPSGNEFAMQTLNSLAGKSITYASAANGIYVELPGEENSTVYAFDGNGANIKYFKAYEEGDVGNRYNLIAGNNITETYYLSTYTYKTDNVFDEAKNTSNAYAFKVTCPKTLVGKVTMQKNTESCASVFLGNIFEQTLNITQEFPSDNRVISSSNNQIAVTAMSTIRFVDSVDKDYFHIQLYENGLSLNQGFLIYLNKYDYNGDPLADNFIKGNPSYTYTVSSTGGSNSITESSVLDEDALYLYTNPIAIPIPEYDENNPNWASTQTAEVTFTFNGSEKELTNEFEARTRDESLAGTEFYVESKFDYVSDNVIYSSNVEDARGTNRYYTQREESLRLKLTAMDQETDDAYDKYGENSNNRSSLGINAKYVYEKTGEDIEHIDVGANLDVSNLPDTFLKGITNPNESYTLRLTVKLMQKQNDSPYAYSYSDVPIDTYLEGFKLTKEGVEIAPIRKEMIDGSSWTDGNGDKYVYEFELTGDPSTWDILFTQTDDYKQFDCGLSFDVLTGDLLENINGYKYANYKIHVAADLYKTGNSSERFEQVSDTLVYTNAKVNAQFVSPSDGD